MTLESQVCSLDLAKRLKELGVKQDSFISWVELPASEKEGYEGEKYGLFYEWESLHNQGRECISAYTSGELGEMLPEKFDRTYKFQGKWIIHFRKLVNPDGSVIAAETEADARALMLIHLIEQGIIDPKKV